MSNTPLLDLYRTCDFGPRLLRAFEGCRDDMHEPDENDVSAEVIGGTLDNADGDVVRDAVGKDDHPHQELVVLVKSPTAVGGIDAFNLASLIAFARVGVRTIEMAARPGVR